VAKEKEVEVLQIFFQVFSIQQSKEWCLKDFIKGNGRFKKLQKGRGMIAFNLNIV